MCPQNPYVLHDETKILSTVQALDRALLVDTLPPSGQPSGNAWAARMLAIGSVLGFFV